ncbi:hypothetical protein [Methylobacterium sp. GC_Met_2]|uniref:hypothetical protein n=1 Tax=Methylobacterium sp. GC_Met_2 TaxID=2937376 RepID=UPI00226B6D78|nr:hypothetical protein [Methylobacterium sp. GC_Met_2]
MRIRFCDVSFVTSFGRRVPPFLAAIAVLLPIAAYAESLDAALSFVEVADEVASKPHVYRQARNLDLSVVDRSSVSDWNARRLGLPNERVQEVKGSIGTPTKIGRTSLLWRLDGPQTVVRETNFPSFVETITITFRPDGCDATVVYHLKPSYDYFGMWNLKTGAPMPISRIRAEDVECKLGAAAVS